VIESSDILQVILPFLGSKEVLEKSLVCKTWLMVTKLESTWKKLCLTDIGIRWLKDNKDNFILHYREKNSWYYIFRDLFIQNIKPSYHDNELKGCKHYSRNCKLLANCCEKFFDCRFCHDEHSDHAINRFDTKIMICMECYYIQPVNKICDNQYCRKIQSHYYCNICKLWDNDTSKKIFHCEGCGLCRIGEKSDFFHCYQCGICLHISGKDDHKCFIKNGLKDPCQICKSKELLFYSRDRLALYHCGHAVHLRCYQSTGGQCSICNH